MVEDEVLIRFRTWGLRGMGRGANGRLMYSVHGYQPAGHAGRFGGRRCSVKREPTCLWR